ncbi:MAG: site-2 protease family protein, partial [Candidatus Micrarchaeota archaeon]|nr:site-2 protease family protein [Candidatus Micrarchaeota archaeon]
SAISIGKIFGIEIDLHWTFLLLLIFSLLVSTYFFVVIVLLFICVLIHELAHSVTALRNNVKVRNIMLLPIGGASMIDETKLHPKVEFNIALAGPMMSLLLGAIFGVLVIIAPMGAATQLLQVLFELNILLGVFNILPAFPMDGGRVFRSYLQKRRNYFDATMLTVRVSKYLMGAIVLGTALFVLFASSYSIDYREFIAVWDLIIVFFLYGGAKSEEQTLIIRRKTAGLHVSDAMTKRYALVKPETRIEGIYNIVRKKKEHLFIMKTKEGYAMLDIFRQAKERKGRFAKDLAVPIPEISQRAQIIDALSKMQSMDVGVIAVVERGKLRGITTGSLLQALISMHLVGKGKNV